MNILWIVAIIAGLIAASLMVGAAMQIDDWGRDLHTNHAATDENASSNLLRPIDANCSVDEAAAAVMRAVGGLPRWSVVHRGEGDRSQTRVIRLIRQTRLFKFTDDITVRIDATKSGCRIEAESRSRLGKGDLGQNPRNLKELLGELRRRLDEFNDAG